MIAKLCLITSLSAESMESPNCKHADTDHDLLILALQYHLAVEATWDPELASAYLHAAAFDGCGIALSILQSMRDSGYESEDSTPPLRLKFDDLPTAIRRFFLRSPESQQSVFNLPEAQSWNLEQLGHKNPVARFNLSAMQFPPEKMRAWFIHTPDYYRPVRFPSSHKDTESPLLRHRPSEAELHAEEWLLSYHQNLDTPTPEETTLTQLAHSIELGSLRAKLYQVKFFPDTTEAETDSDSQIDGLQFLLDQDYPPAWDVQCARLHALIRAKTWDSSESQNVLNTVEKALRYGYERNALRLLSSLMAHAPDEQTQQHAFALFLKSAELGMPSACFSVGFCYRNGWGVEPDPTEAKRWFEVAESHGDPSASFQLGWMYLQEELYPSAFRHFENAAEGGDELAQLQCALMTLEGVGTEADRQLAFRWFEAAADRGNATASLFCGYFHDNAWIEGQPRNLDQALYHYRQSLIGIDATSFDTFFQFLEDRWAQPDANVEGMLLTVDELLSWVPPQHLIHLGMACWQHPTWSASMRWDRAAHYFEAAAAQGDANGRLMQCVFSIHGFAGVPPSQAVAELQSILSEPATSMDPRFRSKTIAALSIAYLSGIGTALNYPAFLTLMDQESLPEGLRSQLDAIAMQSAAYRLYRHQSDYNDTFRRAQFRSRNHPENCPPEAIVQFAASYPRYLEELQLSGNVLISMIIDPEGRILAPMVEESSHPGFEEPAMRALSHWRFLPALRDGKPVRARIRVPIRFRAGSQD